MVIFFLKFICLKKHVNFVVCSNVCLLVRRTEKRVRRIFQQARKKKKNFCLFQRRLTITIGKYKGMKIPGQLSSRTVTRFRSKFNWLILSFFLFFPSLFLPRIRLWWNNQDVTRLFFLFKILNPIILPLSTLRSILGQRLFSPSLFL